MGLCVSAEIVYFLYLWKCSGQLHTINIVLKVRLEDLKFLLNVIQILISGISEIGKILDSIIEN